MLPHITTQNQQFCWQFAVVAPKTMIKVPLNNLNPRDFSRTISQLSIECKFRL